MEHKKTHKIFLPILNRGTWSRVYCIKNPIEKILKSLSEKNPETKLNILSLGSGFDTLYFLLKQNFSNFKYYEFDYGDITAKKIEIIKKSKLLQSVINNYEVKKGTNLQSEDYFILECDITNYEQFNDILCNIQNFDFSLPTVVIAECLLVYIKKEVTMEILLNLTKNFKNLIFLEYDLVGAKDNFGKEMINNLLDRDVRLFGYEDTPDVCSQRERLTKCGFTREECVDMLEFYNKYIDQAEKNKIEKLEFVDEFEEWKLLQSHSCYGYGVKLDTKFEYLRNLLTLYNIEDELDEAGFDGDLF